VVVDALPVGLIPLSFQTEGNFICNLTENPVNGVRCVGDMAAGPGTTAKITIHVFVTANGGPLDNEACVDPDNAVIESNESDNCSTKTTVVNKFSPDISIQKTADKDTTTIGDTLTYTVTASNVGDAPTDTGWTVKDTLPSVVSFVNAVATNGVTCTHDGSLTGGVVTCTPPGSFGVGASTSITIQVHVNDDASTPFTNTAAVDGTVGFDSSTPPCDVADACEAETGANQANNTDSVITSVGGSAIDLVMSDITDSPDPANVGDSLVYTFTVTNGGTQNARAADGKQVVIDAALPTAGVTFQSGIATQGFACVPSSGLLHCTGDLDAGEATTVTVTFTVNALTPPKLTLSAKVDPADAIAETSETNNEATEDTTVNVSACTSCINLVMGQIFAIPSPVNNNNQVVYSFTVTNTGDLPTSADPTPNTVAIGIDLDTTFDESSFASFTAPAGWTCGAGIVFDVECTSTNPLAAGDGALITITVNVATSSTPSFVDFDATVDPSNDIAELTDSDNHQSLRVDVN